MKFSLIAMLGVVTAEQVAVVEDIHFNKTGLDNAVKFAGVAGKVLAKQNHENAVKNKEALVDAYSTYVVEEHVGASKNFTPLAKFHVEMADAITPHGKCNQQKATECVNTWQLGGFRDEQKPEMVKCYTKAGCISNYQAATPAQRNALKESYQTSQETLVKAYTKMDDQFMANLKRAHEKNMRRQEALAEEFYRAVDHESEILGCGRKCYNYGVQHHHSPGQIMEECCNDGVIRINYTNVNVAAVIENNYGPIENLSMEEFQEVDKSLTQAYGQFREIRVHHSFQGRHYSKIYVYNNYKTPMFNAIKVDDMWARFDHGIVEREKMAATDAAGVQKAKADILKVKANDIKLVKDYKVIVERLAYLDKLEDGLHARYEKAEKDQDNIDFYVEHKLDEKMHKLKVAEHKIQVAKHNIANAAHKVIVAEHKVDHAERVLDIEKHNIGVADDRIDVEQAYLNKVKEEIHQKSIDNMHEYQADVEFIRKH